MKYKINLGNKIVDHTGRVDENLTYAKVLATVLASAPEGDKLKFFNWAQELHKTGSVELDDSDFTMLYDFVKTGKAMTATATAPILSTMNDVRARVDKKEDKKAEGK